MRRFALRLLCQAMSIAACFVALSGSSMARADFETIAGWDNQVFPSYLIGTAAIKEQASDEPLTLGDALGSFGVSVTAPTDKTEIKVTIACDAIAESSEFVGVLAKKGETYKVFPKMRYNFGKLSSCRQATPSIVVYRVQIGDKPVMEKTATITVRSINDCPFALLQDEEVVDLSVVFAVYVNEQHPFVDKLLRESLDIGRVDSFIGYQGKTKESVLAQVYAMWDLLVARDVRYSSITATAASSNQTHSQHVRLLEETINNTQANCVDGSVLFVSMLRKVGIDAALVITEDHCYVAFWTDPEHECMYGLETTMMGQEVELDETPEELDGCIAPELRWEYSWASFIGAIATGTSNLQKAIETKDETVQLIDVATARLNGVLPIPFDGKEEFVHVDFIEDEDESDIEEASDENSEDTEEEETNNDDSADSEVTWDDSATSKKKSGSLRRKSPATSDVQWE